MKAKDLQAEIQASLTAALQAFLDVREYHPADARALQELMSTCAANLAQGLAWRTLTEDIAATAQELASTAPKTLALWVAKDVREGLGEE